MEQVPYLGPFITLKLMSVRDPVLSPVKLGRCDPAMLLHLLKEYVDPAMMMGAMAYKEMSCRCWLALLWPLLFGLSSSWVPKPPPVVDDPDRTDCGDDDADLSAAGVETQVDELPNSQGTHEDKRVLGKSGTVDFSFRAVSRLLSGQFPVHVWRMLADTKDVDLLAVWMVQTLPQLMQYGQQYGIENVSKGRLGSIHLLALARGFFAVAELDCIGVVQVEDGEITKESLLEFREVEKKHWKMMKAKSSSYTRSRYSNQELAGLLSNASAKYSAATGNGSCLPSKTYLVADLYVKEVPGVWDSYVDTVAPNMYGTMMLLEYLLVALLGQRCWGWKAADLDERIRQKQLQLSREAWLTGANAEQIISNYRTICCANSG